MISTIRAILFAAILITPHAYAQSPERNADEFSDAGVEALIRGQAQEAIQNFQAALQLNPKHAKALNGLGVAQLQLGNIETATQQFIAAVEANPSSVTPLMNLGDLAVIQSEAAAALKYYALVLNVESGNAEATTKLSRLHRMAGAPDEGLALVEQALERHPSNVDLLVEAGACRMQSGEPGRALETLIMATRIDGDHPDALLWSGRAFAKTTQWPHAEKKLLRLIQLQPSGIAHLELARVYAWSGYSAAKATEQAKLATKLDPLLADAHALLGTLLLQQDDIIPSIGALEKAIAIEREHCPARVALSEISVKRGMLDVGESHLKYCLDKTWDFAEAHLAKVYIDAQSGDCGAARAGVEWLKKHAPELDTDAKRAAKRCK